MSADRTTTCPACREEWELREYFYIGMSEDQPTVTIEYHCECRACTFDWAMPKLMIEVPKERL